MFTETASGENADEAMDSSFVVVDSDLGIAELPVSPTSQMDVIPHDESSMDMVKLNHSEAELHLAFESLSVIEHLVARDDAEADLIKADDSKVASLYNLILMHNDGQNNGMESISSETANIREVFAEGKASQFVETDQICELSCKSSTRCMNNKMFDHEKKPITLSNSRKPGEIPGFDFTSLKILRKSRSSSTKPARSSIWGSQVHLHVLPNTPGNVELDINSASDIKIRRVRGRKGKTNSRSNRSGKKSTGRKDNASRHPTGQKSSDKNSLPMRHISLKIKIGNRSCGIGVDEKNISAPGKEITDGDNFGASSGNQFSDVGTSPDSEVINPVPDAPRCEKSLPRQDTSSACIASVSPADIPISASVEKASEEGKKNELPCEEGSNFDKLMGAGPANNAHFPCSFGEISCLSLPPSYLKKGRKKGKPRQVGWGSGETKLNGLETMNNDRVTPDLEEGHVLPDIADSREDLGTKGSAASQVPGMFSNNIKMSSEPIESKKARSKVSKLRRKGDKIPKKKAEYENIVSDQHQATDKSNDLGEHSRNDGPPETVRDQYNPSRNAWVLCDNCQKWRRIPAKLADQIEETNCGWTCNDNMDKDFANCSVPQEKSNLEINVELELSDGSAEEDSCDTFLRNHKESKVSDQPSWSPIKSNLFLHRRRKTQTIDEVMVCHCKPPSDGRLGCGDKCLNRMLNIECVRGTCPCGNLCSNQQFQKRKYAKLKLLRYGKKGYGLQAVEDISEGRFLIEYVGEVLDVRTYEARQREYAMKGHRHFYFMTLNGSEVIDACAKGNLGRFINHSCEPNCSTEKWMVNGEVCVGLFALRNIKKGEEVTFDYNYVRVFGAAAKKCVCGSNNCRGYIGGDPAKTELIAQDDSDEEYAEPVLISKDKKIHEDLKEKMSKLSQTGEKDVLKSQSVKKCSIKKSIYSADKSIIDPTSNEKVDGVSSAEVAEKVGKRLELKDSTGKSSASESEDLHRSRISEESVNGTEFKVKSLDLETQIHSLPQPFDSLPSEGVFSQSKPTRELACNTSSPCKESLSEAIESKRRLEKSPLGGKEDLHSPRLLAKTKGTAFPIKRLSKKINVLKGKGIPELKTLDAPADKFTCLVEVSSSGHFEAVEKKLNELLDPEGGISKRKDASKGYLKLLFLTAASENSGDGEAIQSNRDLSMILDALLKTKSRSVLVDIINKNGLQMLHNIMKRCRKEFIKTPILRKLLKVLEYLAVRAILTLEHITGGPPRPGVESFKDSILTLTEHADKQVHQIARSFRDRWIPKHLRRRCCIDRDERRIQPAMPSTISGSPNCLNDRGRKSPGSHSQPNPASGSVGTSDTLGRSSCVSSNRAADGKRIRKRKSRWDCPAEDYPNSRTRANFVGEQKDVDNDMPPGFSSFHDPGPVSVAPPIASSNQAGEVKHEDIPPGFSSPRHAPVIHESPLSAAAVDLKMDAHVEGYQDSRTGNRLADDEKMNTEKDRPPSFSSTCSTVVIQSGPSSFSVCHQEETRCTQQTMTSNGFTRDERIRSDVGFCPGFSSPADHMVPPGGPVTDISYQERDSNMQQYPCSGARRNRQSIDDGNPPGFSSPCSGPTPVSGDHQGKVIRMDQNQWSTVCGEPQLKFDAQMSLAYGVPYSAVQIFGILKSEGWIRAPGVPFCSFPPRSPSSVEVVENSEQSSNSTFTHPGTQNCSSTSNMGTPQKYACVERSRQGTSNNFGRKFFRQQKGSHPKLPPWVRMRNGWSNSAV